MQTKQDPREPVLLMALENTLHANCVSQQLITFLICMFWHLLRIFRVLLVEGRGGKAIQVLTPHKMFLIVKGSRSVIHNDALSLAGTLDVDR